MNTKYNFFKGFIPGLIPNRMVLFSFSLLSLLTGHIRKKTRDLHYEENQRILSDVKNGFFKENEYVENQDSWEKIKFGSHKKANMAYSGCEIIATYNCLLSLGERGNAFPELIRYFEKRGNALRGGFGIAPSYPADFMKKRGYGISRLTSRNTDRVNKFGQEHDTFLLTFYWDKKDITRQLHTVNISKNDRGFFVHNSGTLNKNAALGPFDRLGDAILSLGKDVAIIVIYGLDKK